MRLYTCTCDGHAVSFSAAAADVCVQDSLSSDAVLGLLLQVPDLQHHLLSWYHVDSSLKDSEEKYKT